MPETGVPVTENWRFFYASRRPLTQLSKRLLRRLYRHYCLSCLCLFSAPEIFSPDAHATKKKRRQTVKVWRRLISPFSGSCDIGLTWCSFYQWSASLVAEDSDAGRGVGGGQTRETSNDTRWCVTRESTTCTFCEDARELTLNNTSVHVHSLTYSQHDCICELSWVGLSRNIPSEPSHRSSHRRRSSFNCSGETFCPKICMKN